MKTPPQLLTLAALVCSLLCSALPALTLASVPFPHQFAPQEGVVKPPEQPFRQELCLNGLWQFQPVAIPGSYKQDQGVAPELSPPQPDGWAATPIKIPSPWNVNTWGPGRRDARDLKRVYWPDSVYYPSYPAQWDSVRMGWLRRSFHVPSDWRGRRILLHFEGVAGQCQAAVNGRKVGEHFDAWLPFEVDITDQIRWDGDNELLVGVRHPHLFDKTSSRYPKFRSPYPPGSYTDSLVGIWQDVFLLAAPAVRVADTFVKPLVGQGKLELNVELVNNSGRDETVKVDGEVCPWINEAGQEVLTAPEPKWRLGAAALSISGSEVMIAAGQRTTVVLRQPVGKQLRLWSPKSPNLYGVVISVRKKGSVVDRHYTRFGWREFTLGGSALLLNGEKIQLVGDLVHPFGPFFQSRRYVWAYYRMIKDFGGNAVRPHAQVHPRIYLEMADEMGLTVLEETSVFGSSIRLNPEEPVFWERYAAHYDGMILRDRNHPSVMGWSFGNEMFAIPMLNKMSEGDKKEYYEKLTAMIRRSPALDPTRQWISCDGDEALNGALPVWSKHFGHGLPVDRLPANPAKPLMVGESGGTYYATPKQLAVFNGDRAFESYLGRNEALAIDLYNNVAAMALPKLAYFSASEVVWFGLEHLNFGYSDFSRLPGMQDGVLCSAPYVEGKPGIQPERIPPYVATVNPGWDAALPLYKPLPMFDAMKAALAAGGPKPCPWDHRPTPPAKRAPMVKPTVEQVALAAAGGSALPRQLAAWGVPVATNAAEIEKAGMLVIDGQSLTEAQAAEIRAKMDRVLTGGGAVLLMIHDAKAPVKAINALLSSTLTLTDRQATMVQPHGEHPWTAGLGLEDLYDAEAKGDRQIVKCGLAGPLVERGRVVLEASNTDWSQFNDVPENAKCAAVVLYEHLQKPSGAALVRVEQGNGTVALCSLDYRIASPTSLAMWRRLLGNMGVRLGNPNSKAGDTVGGGKEHDLLLNGPVN